MCPFYNYRERITRESWQIVADFAYRIPLFHTGPESYELTRIGKYLHLWLNRTQFVKILTDSHSQYS